VSTQKESDTRKEEHNGGRIKGGTKEGQSDVLALREALGSHHVTKKKDTLPSAEKKKT